MPSEDEAAARAQLARLVGLLNEFVDGHAGLDGDAALGIGEFAGAPPCECPACRLFRAVAPVAKIQEMRNATD